MSQAARHLGAHPASRRWWLVAVLLLLIGAGCFGIGLHRHLRTQADLAPPPFAPSSTSTGSATASASGSPTASPSATAASKPAAPHVTLAATVGRSRPTLLRIPAIGVSVSLSELGLNPDGTVEVPTDFAQPGWFNLGPAPGQLGSSVILGHVHSRQGPAIFWRLGKLRAGDQIAVRLADGDMAHYAVTKVAAYAKADFPSRLVYAAQGRSTLQLVTCGGVYDKRNHRYLSNVVVYTSLVSTKRAS
jgi:LPXTG-site transpeptidase (sortase) family protein